MTEKRENLPFESKVQFIKEFWDKKDTIKDLEKAKNELLTKNKNLTLTFSY